MDYFLNNVKKVIDATQYRILNKFKVPKPPNIDENLKKKLKEKQQSILLATPKPLSKSKSKSISKSKSKSISKSSPKPKTPPKLENTIKRPYILQGKNPKFLSKSKPIPKTPPKSETVPTRIVEYRKRRFNNI
jgi:hypothetical protein